MKVREKIRPSRGYFYGEREMAKWMRRCDIEVGLMYMRKVVSGDSYKSEKIDTLLNIEMEEGDYRVYVVEDIVVNNEIGRYLIGMNIRIDSLEGFLRWCLGNSINKELNKELIIKILKDEN